MPISHVAVKFLSIEVRSGVAYYTISVTDLQTKETWIFQSRYSRMRIVHDCLQTIAQEDVPIFPPKRCCFNTETAFVSQRQKALENYFNIVLKNNDLAELAPLKQFLYGEKSTTPNRTKKTVTIHKDDSEERDYNNIYLGPKKSLGLKNAVDNFAYKFIDLALNLTPPEEDDVKRKKSAVLGHKWPKLTSKMMIENRLPKGNEQNLIYIKKETFIRKNEEFYHCMEGIMKKMRMKHIELKDYFEPETLVHLIVIEKIE